MFDAAVHIDAAPTHWSEQCVHRECRLHQLSPYIGKLKSSIAVDLIAQYTRPGDLVVDPFCGSGTIPLECVLADRKVLASDTSSYAVLLTKAKLHPPKDLDEGLRRLHRILRLSSNEKIPDLRHVPTWVKQFFHPQTLREILAFADCCIREDEVFLLACLLGILHHQRPGFLSYPSSHLVPYLRDKKYPPSSFPEMYKYRDLETRMAAKLSRALKDTVDRDQKVSHSVLQVGIEALSVEQPIDAVITSPPYMNALDYRRDNRLRLWFLERDTANYAPEPTDSRGSFATMVSALKSRVLTRLKVGGSCIFVVGETVRRKRITSHPATLLVRAMAELEGQYCLSRVLEDQIPDVRRSRREYRATKKELILVFEKKHSTE